MRKIVKGHILENMDSNIYEAVLKAEKDDIKKIKNIIDNLDE